MTATVGVILWRPVSPVWYDPLMTSAARTTRKPTPTRAAPAPAVAAFGRPLHRFSVEDYHRMMDLGLIRKEHRCVLIHGLLVEKPPINPPHATSVCRVMKFFLTLFGLDAAVRVRLPITLSDSEPQPDLVLASGTNEEYTARHPGPQDIVFLIEVADSSVEIDRGTKLALYAGAGIVQYWVVDLTARRVEVYTQPHGGKNPGYRKRVEYAPGDVVPVVAGGKKVGTIPVDELLA